MQIVQNNMQIAQNNMQIAQNNMQIAQNNMQIIVTNTLFSTGLCVGMAIFWTFASCTDLEKKLGLPGTRLNFQFRKLSWVFLLDSNSIIGALAQ